MSQEIAVMQAKGAGAIAARLERVSQRFEAELHSDLPCVNELTRHVERFRGKMLRPGLVFAAADAIGGDDLWARHENTLITLGVVVEMVHMATLVHDDVLDEAEVRRRGATINRLRGNEAAVMLGDYLISHAYHLCSALDMPPVHGDTRPVSRLGPVRSLGRAVAAATNTVCEGELLQLSHRHDWTLNESIYFDIVRRKTASLCGLCCQLPVIVAGTWQGLEEGRVEAALAHFGERLGIAFQIVDDVLDLTGDTEVVGKTLGLDLAKGKLTLPLIRLLEVVSPDERTQLVRVLEAQVDPELPQKKREAGVHEIRERIESSQALDYATQWAERIVEKACQEIEQVLPETPGRSTLVNMAKSLLTRRY